MKDKLLFFTSLILSVVLLVLAGLIKSEPRQAVAGVSFGNEYMSTSTTPGFVNHTLLKTGSGSFGAVVITGTGTASGNIEFYDATTTNISLRGGTSTTTLASFPNNTTVGTYTLDVVFTKGLLVSYNPGAPQNTLPSGVASSTITWR